MIGLVIIFIALIILYLGVILFAGATFVKISLFALDKLAVFIASWYYTHHYFSVQFSSGYAIYFWDVLAAILAVIIYSILFQIIHKNFKVVGKILNLAISFFSSMTVYCILVHGFITNGKSKILFSTTLKQQFYESGGQLYYNLHYFFGCMEKKRGLPYGNESRIKKKV